MAKSVLGRDSLTQLTINEDLSMFLVSKVTKENLHRTLMHMHCRLDQSEKRHSVLHTGVVWELSMVILCPLPYIRLWPHSQSVCGIGSILSLETSNKPMRLPSWCNQTIRNCSWMSRYDDIAGANPANGLDWVLTKIVCLRKINWQTYQVKR